MPRLLIIWHSATGGSEQLAHAAAAGAAEHGAQVEMRHAAQAGPSDLLASDGYIFAAPENLASLAGVAKDFFDRCYYPLLGRIEGRPYASLICAGSDGSGAARQIERIATGWRLRAVAEPLIICTHAQTPEAILAPKIITPPDLARAHLCGATLGAGLQLGIF